MGGGVSTDVKSSNRIEISQLGQGLSSFLVILPDPTHYPTHPPKLPIHPPMGGGVSTDVKSSNRIEISQLGQGLFDF